MSAKAAPLLYCSDAYSMTIMGDNFNVGYENVSLYHEKHEPVDGASNVFPHHNQRCVGRVVSGKRSKMWRGLSRLPEWIGCVHIRPILMLNS